MGQAGQGTVCTPTGNGVSEKGNHAERDWGPMNVLAGVQYRGSWGQSETKRRWLLGQVGQSSGQTHGLDFMKKPKRGELGGESRQEMMAKGLCGRRDGKVTGMALTVLV